MFNVKILNQKLFRNIRTNILNAVQSNITKCNRVQPNSTNSEQKTLYSFIKKKQSYLSEVISDYYKKSPIQ